MSKKRVLLLSEGFGTGHTQAAHALNAGLKYLSPNISAKVLELGSFLNPIVAPMIISAYRKTVSKQPRVVGLMYRSNYKKPTNRIAKLALHRLFYTQALQLIKQLKPDAIICTHPVPNMVVARLKKLGLDIPLLTVITDYDAHGSWVNHEVNHYFVSTDIVKQRLMEKGVLEQKIKVTGIPVHPKFWNHHDEDEVRQQLHLKDMPTVMIMGGGWGILHEDSALSYLTKWRDQTQLLYCVGSNEEMLLRLQQDPLFQHPNVHFFGFTKEIDKLMEISDLLITKPGGMTCTEGLSKGLPMLFYEPIPGQEEENCEYFINMGYGEMLESNAVLDRWMRLIHDKDSLRAYRQKLIDVRDRNYNPQSCTKAVLQILQ